jgi:GNAT superfamily N-acetyltransferase
LLDLIVALARPTLYLEDIFVRPELRGKGIGRALLQHCLELADKRGCGRMEWTCLDWNTKAQAAYKRLGARQMKEWFLYRMDREGIVGALKGGSGRVESVGGESCERP